MAGRAGEGRGVVLRLENGRWEPQHYRGPYLSAITISPPASSGSVTSPAPLLVWAAEDDYLGGVARYDGDTWQHEPLPTPPALSTPDPWRSYPRQWRLLDIVALPSGELWGVGAECAAHYVPSRGWEWSADEDILYSSLLSVSFAKNDEGFAVGGGGKIVGHSRGAWDKVESPTGNTLRSVDMVMVSAAEGGQSSTGSVGWAVGDYGTILRYGQAEGDGQQGRWEQLDTGLPDSRSMTLNGVDAVSPDEAWAVGSMLGKGVILRYKADPGGSGEGKWLREARLVPEQLDTDIPLWPHLKP